MKLLQDGANSAFHEAVGDTFFYSIFGPAHLQRLGLADDTDGSSEDGSSEDGSSEDGELTAPLRTASLRTAPLRTAPLRTVR